MGRGSSPSRGRCRRSVRARHQRNAIQHTPEPLASGWDVNQSLWLAFFSWTPWTSIGGIVWLAFEPHADTARPIAATVATLLARIPNRCTMAGLGGRGQNRRSGSYCPRVRPAADTALGPRRLPRAGAQCLYGSDPGSVDHSPDHLLWLVASGVRVVQEYERGVLFVFGRCRGATGPGHLLRRRRSSTGSSGSTCRPRPCRSRRSRSSRRTT